MSTPARQPARTRPGPALRAVVRTWVELTPDEQRAVLLVLGLFLTGVLARLWYTLR